MRKTMSSSSSRCSFTNLERMLQCFTPDVPKRILPKSCLNDVNKQWLPVGKDKIEFFTLKDLWECYDEWSIYGAGTPVVLESGDTLTQYYIPFLSAIQIYTNKPVQAPSSRNRRDRNDGVEFESNSSCDGSGSDLSGSSSKSDSSTDGSGSGDLSGSSSKSDSSSDGSGSGDLDRSPSSGNNSSKEWDDISFYSTSDQVPKGDILGYLNFQYTETAQPYLRVPLAEKIAELAKSHPGLLTLKSVDLSPASWMAVAWYPIYAIPSLPNETCFLTYHSLSSSFEECANKYEEVDLEKDICCPTGWGSIVGEKFERRNSDCISLSPFGLATYRFQGDVWLSPSHDNEKLSDLFGAADSWLKQINAAHHDFKFFIDNNTLFFHQVVHKLFECWLAEQNQHLKELLDAESAQLTDEYVQALINRVVEHYDYYYKAKSRWAKQDMLAMLSSTWRSSLKDAFRLRPRSYSVAKKSVLQGTPPCWRVCHFSS